MQFFWLNKMLEIPTWNSDKGRTHGDTEITVLGSYCSRAPRWTRAEIWVLGPKPSPTWLSHHCYAPSATPLTGSLAMMPLPEPVQEACFLVPKWSSSGASGMESPPRGNQPMLYWLSLSEKWKDHSAISNVSKNFQKLISPSQRSSAPSLGATLVSSDIVTRQPSQLRFRLLHSDSLPQHSLTHHRVKDPHWKIWPETIAGTIPGTIPPPPPCICTASAKPNLNSVLQKPAWKLCNRTSVQEPNHLTPWHQTVQKMN